MNPEVKTCPICGAAPTDPATDRSGASFTGCSNNDCWMSKIGLLLTVEQWNQRSDRWIKTTDRLPDCETWVLLFLVTNNPAGSGIVKGQRSSFHEGQFWGDDMYRPMAWISHWMPLPEPPPKPWTRP